MLATIQRIKEIKPHTNADSLELAIVLGWQVVVKKEEFKAGDLCVYITIDSIVPETSPFEFLRNKNFRISPIKLRGEPSNGLCMPISILPKKTELVEGKDVTSIVGVKKYERPMPTNLCGKAIGYLPSYLIMTDELNLRNYPRALEELQGKEYYITIKIDGGSATYFLRNGEFGVCSRQWQLVENYENGFWKLAKKYKIKECLKDAFPEENICIQGEAYGEGINKNKLRIRGADLALFNLFDISTRTYLPFEELCEFCENYDIPMVPILEAGINFDYSLKDLVKMANEQKYSSGEKAEGIVIRPKHPFNSFKLNKSWSGKIINESYKE